MKRLALSLCAMFACCLPFERPSAAEAAETTAAYAAAPGAALAAGVPELRNVQDLGRARGSEPVSIAVLLAYHHDTELQRLIELQGDERSPYYHHFLTNDQFAQYFAPTPDDQRRVLQSLRAAGFRITATYANRTMVDATAPAALAERYFSTVIHRVSQPGVGIRYANVRPALMPAELRGVTAVTGLSNIISARTTMEMATAGEKAAAKQRALALFGYDGTSLAGTRVKNFRAPSAAPAAARLATTGNVIQDPSFESGKLTQWQICSDYSPTDPEITSAKAHTGKYSGFGGSVSATSGEINTDAGLCQSITIPTSGVLSFWVYQYSNEPNTTNAFQEADLLDYSGTRIVQFYKTVATTAGWKQLTFNLSQYAGHRYFFYFGVEGNGNKTHETYQYVDDVSLTGSGFPVTGTKIGGPLVGPDYGYGPAVVADSYDLPVQHGYDGSGRATGVAISGDYAGSDLYAYMYEFGITRGGTTTRVEVDGGSKFTAGGAGSSEATLDVETIVSLAPSTQLYMYLIPDLSEKHIEDDYNQVVSDNRVDVLNSSFGGCETSSTAYDLAVDKIVAQGAAKGITFSASSGDYGSAACSGKTGLLSPASTPDVVAVGGTSMYPLNNGSYGSEAAWSGSGGGVSSVWQLPSYQVGVKGIVGNTRNVPDIAFPADPNTGTSFYFSGAWSGPTGGTSWASPIFSALLTESDQRHNSRAGYMNPAIYSVYKKYGLSAFHDITSGSNGAYGAHAGYDNVTGIGSVKGYYFSGVE